MTWTILTCLPASRPRPIPLARRLLVHTVVLWVSAVLSLALVQAAEFDGFTEPFREVEVASPEPGIITQMPVQEGEHVEAGQVLSILDHDIHTALLAIAEQNKQSTGRLEALQAELELRRDRARQFERLHQRGHARQEEFERARMELEIAAAQVKAAREERLIKDLEYRKSKVQLDRRTISSPIDGVVTELHRDVGEFVAPNSPGIMTVVQLDPLVAAFSLPGPHTEQLVLHQEVAIAFPLNKQTAPGRVTFISPVTDAESGMVRVKVQIPNPDGKLRSGQRCLIHFADGDDQ